MSHNWVHPLTVTLMVFGAVSVFYFARLVIFWWQAGRFHFTVKERGLLLKHILKKKLRLSGFFQSTSALSTVIATVSADESDTRDSSGLLEKLYYAYATLDHKLSFVGLTKKSQQHKTTESLPLGLVLTIEFTSGLRKNAKLLSKESDILLLRFMDDIDEYTEDILVYFWNHDAGYRFKSHVLKKKGLHMEITGSKSIHQYLRRAHPRVKLDESAHFFLLGGQESANYEVDYHNPGFECVIRDISEGGAAIIAEGRGQIGLHIKLQFSLRGKDLVMCGTIKDVYYNHEYNQSTLHMQADKDMPFKMKEPILAYVYAVTGTPS
ncbi:PilZ domain-containing protein [Entomospira entomophila]|uniref:PilZ domain-containing protein n=1 Tax=Entomospira entomophila TaxID=2719988 RepID=A0A968G8B2_9SPIO|nr:PilZ domain-containing protein [Entomospira entomophilus]NIZ40415.1 PilZ domain-containing protein [Entomospira entomophilus]WDI35973.1 PilZ domain-containing protein [Entomospira entomophilus]